MDPRRSSLAALRNRDPILAVLAPALSAGGTVLEIASGSGEHVAHFARALPHLDWQPSDPDPSARASIAAQTAGLANVAPPLDLDVVSGTGWPVAPVAAILATNLLHISPWAATEGLMAGAARLLAPGGLLVVYGPFILDDVPLEPSNAAFDADLRARNPAWGLRPLSAVMAVAAAHGLGLERRHDMPANNRALLFRRQPDAR
jgi:hypothetical protein